LEHKGLYWSKIPGTEGAMSIEPDEDYVVPIGKSRVVQQAEEKFIQAGNSVGVITYGRGVYWSLEASKTFNGQIEIIDLRSLNPLDEVSLFDLTHRHGKIIVVTEESEECAFALSIAGRIQRNCFSYLDAPIEVLGSVDTPAIPLNSDLEAAILPNAHKVSQAIQKLLAF